MRTHIPLIIKYYNIINFTVALSKILLRKYISYTYKDWECRYLSFVICHTCFSQYSSYFGEFMDFLNKITVV